MHGVRPNKLTRATLLSYVHNIAAVSCACAYACITPTLSGVCMHTVLIRLFQTSEHPASRSTELQRPSTSILEHARTNKH